MATSEIYSFPTRKNLSEEYAIEILERFHSALKINDIAKRRKAYFFLSKTTNVLLKYSDRANSTAHGKAISLLRKHAEVSNLRQSEEKAVAWARWMFKVESFFRLPTQKKNNN